jgi:PUB domain/VHL beta domain
MGVLEYWQWTKQQTGHQQQQQCHMTTVSSTLTYEPMAAEATTSAATFGTHTTTSFASSTNPIGNPLEEQSEQVQTEAGTPVSNTCTPPDDDCFYTDETPDHDSEQTPQTTNQSDLSTARRATTTTTKIITPSSSSVSSTLTSRTSNRSSNEAQVAPSRRKITATSNQHPGMDAFCHWYDVQTSLYRIYTLGRHDGVEVAPPYIPHSYRGQTTVKLHVTNQTSAVLKVYWVDYKGHHVLKGTLKPNQVWHQTTWIDHPWVFEGDSDDQPTPFLYFIPYKVMPTLKESPTTSEDDFETGLYKFAIVPPTNYQHSTKYYCGVKDEIMPFSSNDHPIANTPVAGISWTLEYMSRLGISWDDPRIDLLQKYLSNIVQSPDVVKYRQLRTRSNGIFGNSIWNSPLQGLFLAVGFVEVQGNAELGCEDEPLSRERIQDLALLSYMVTTWKQKEMKREFIEQPIGAMDGYGRAGFARVGM